MPVFGRQEALTRRQLRVEYDEEDPSRLLREVEISQDEADPLPRDGMGGFEYIEQRPARLMRPESLRS